MTVSRFSISLEEKLLKELDLFVQDNSFSNRSQAVRYLVEKSLVEKKWKCNNTVAGAVVLIFDFQKREIQLKITEIQYHYSEVVLSSQQYQFDCDVCMVIIAVKGIANKLTELADKLISIKGLKHGKLIMSRTD